MVFGNNMPLSYKEGITDLCAFFLRTDSSDEYDDEDVDEDEEVDDE
jgi:hypothetical protein